MTGHRFACPTIARRLSAARVFLTPADYREAAVRQISVSVRVIGLVLSLLLSTAGLDRHAMAQTQEAFDAQVSVFDSKLKLLQSMQSDLDARVRCLDQRDAQLTAQRAQKELELGKLRADEQQWLTKVGQQQAAYDGFRQAFDLEQSKLRMLRNELAHLQAQKRWQEEWIQQCKREKDWKRLWGLTCEADMNLAKTFGQIKSYEGDIAATTKKEETARGSMEATRADLNASEGALTEARKRSSEVKAAITETESTLRNVSRILAEVRTSVQPFQIVIGDLSAALNEAKEVNLEDKRKRTLYTLSFIGQKADTAIARGNHAISQTDITLGQGWTGQCVTN